MTVVVKLRNNEEERVLLAFLDSLQYDYQNEADYISLTEEQQKEVLRREQAFAEGKTAAHSWNDIKNELESIYR